MKYRKILLFFSSLLFLLIVFEYYYSEFYSRESPKLQYQVLENGEQNGLMYFEHVLENVGDKKVKIKFLSNKEVDVSLQSLSPIDISVSNVVGQNYSNNKNGRTILLRPGEKITNIVYVKSKELPNGEYELLLRLALDNMKTKPLRVKFVVE